MTGELVLAWANIKRHGLRNILLLLTIAIGFLIFGVLGTLGYSMSGGSDKFAMSRLMVMSQAGLIEPLPLSYKQRIEAIDGVGSVGYATWFGLYYQDTRQDILTFAVETDSWIAQHPEMIVDEQAINEFLTNKNSLLVSHHIAGIFGWQVGDVVPLKSILFQPDSGEEFWSFKIAGLFRNTEESGGRKYMIAHYDYLNDNRRLWKDTVGTFIVVPQDGVSANDLAIAIDDEFLRSSRQTLTATDKAFHDEFFAQIGDLFFMIQSIVIVSFLSIFIVVSSTIALTVRQRTTDIAVMKTLGFSNFKVFRIIYLETLGLTVVGGVLGLLFAVLVNFALIRYWPIIPDINVPYVVMAQASGLMVLLGLLSGSLPGVLALQMKPIEAFKVDT